MTRAVVVPAAAAGVSVQVPFCPVHLRLGLGACRGDDDVEAIVECLCCLMGCLSSNPCSNKLGSCLASRRSFHHERIGSALAHAHHVMKLKLRASGTRDSPGAPSVRGASPRSSFPLYHRKASMRARESQEMTTPAITSRFLRSLTMVSIVFVLLNQLSRQGFPDPAILPPHSISGTPRRNLATVNNARVT